MQECTLLLPTLDKTTIPTKEFSDVHSTMIEEIVKAFGNCRATSSVQFVMDDKSKFHDVDCIEYKFVVPAKTEIGIKEFLINTAKKYGKLCNAKQIYIVTHLGSAQFVEV